MLGVSLVGNDMGGGLIGGVWWKEREPYKQVSKDRAIFCSLLFKVRNEIYFLGQLLFAVFYDMGYCLGGIVWQVSCFHHQLWCNVNTV